MVTKIFHRWMGWLPMEVMGVGAQWGGLFRTGVSAGNELGRPGNAGELGYGRSTTADQLIHQDILLGGVALDNAIETAGTKAGPIVVWRANVALGKVGIA